MVLAVPAGQAAGLLGRPRAAAAASILGDIELRVGDRGHPVAARPGPSAARCVGTGFLVPRTSPVGRPDRADHRVHLPHPEVARPGPPRGRADPPVGRALRRRPARLARRRRADRGGRRRAGRRPRRRRRRPARRWSPAGTGPSPSTGWATSSGRRPDRAGRGRAAGGGRRRQRLPRAWGSRPCVGSGRAAARTVLASLDGTGPGPQPGRSTRGRPEPPASPPPCRRDRRPRRPEPVRRPSPGPATAAVAAVAGQHGARPTGTGSPRGGVPWPCPPWPPGSGSPCRCRPGDSGSWPSRRPACCGGGSAGCGPGPGCGRAGWPASACYVPGLLFARGLHPGRVPSCSSPSRRSSWGWPAWPCPAARSWPGPWPSRRP